MHACTHAYMHVLYLSRLMTTTPETWFLKQLDFRPRNLSGHAVPSYYPKQRQHREACGECAWSCALLSAWKRAQSGWPLQAGPARALLGLMYAQLPPLSAHTGASPAQRTGALSDPAGC